MKPACGYDTQVPCLQLTEVRLDYDWCMCERFRPDLGIGTTVDCFQESGRWPVLIDLLNSVYNDGAILAPCSSLRHNILPENV